MRVLVITNQPNSDSVVDCVDVEKQRDAVVESLQRVGHQTTVVECSLNLEKLVGQLSEFRPDVVFNLVESLGGTDRLITLVPWLLDSLGVPYTGASAEAILLTTNKVNAKRRMCESGLPTPEWMECPSNCDLTTFQAQTDTEMSREHQAGHRWMIKPIWEHASAGLDDDSVVELPIGVSPAGELWQRCRLFNRAMFAERYVDGREFNLSILFGNVLPPAEIDFSSYPVGKPRIVGFRAKWEEESFEFRNTPRRFLFGSGDMAILEKLKGLASECWRVFNLSGAARVDFRVDEYGQPWILEINVNPCLSRDAGFASAVEQSGLTYDSVMDQLVQNALSMKVPATMPSQSSQIPTSRTKLEGNRWELKDSVDERFQLREHLRDTDQMMVRSLVESTGFFSPSEIDVAEELVRERREKGLASGYHFLFVEKKPQDTVPVVLGYACYGPIACTADSWDLYWIVVAPESQGSGIGRMIIQEVEKRIVQEGGRQIYIDTSGKPQYGPTRIFYERCGYRVATVLPDFYGEHDDKVLWRKQLRSCRKSDAVVATESQLM